MVYSNLLLLLSKLQPVVRLFYRLSILQVKTLLFLKEFNAPLSGVKVNEPSSMTTLFSLIFAGS